MVPAKATPTIPHDYSGTSPPRYDPNRDVPNSGQQQPAGPAAVQTTFAVAEHLLSLVKPVFRAVQREAFVFTPSTPSRCTDGTLQNERAALQLARDHLDRERKLFAIEHSEVLRRDVEIEFRSVTLGWQEARLRAWEANLQQLEAQRIREQASLESDREDLFVDAVAFQEFVDHQHSLLKNTLQAVSEGGSQQESSKAGNTKNDVQNERSTCVVRYDAAKDGAGCVEPAACDHNGNSRATDCVSLIPASARFPSVHGLDPNVTSVEFGPRGRREVAHPSLIPVPISTRLGKRSLPAHQLDTGRKLAQERPGLARKDSR
ncbi:hypothetical protein LTR10_008225 [Elasticomyces elasticus]|nr:hypothetical protein LTR10_008225 [Elasticomyces elasticus]KAK4967101.1 hypothetical protein LTR42_010449 [Elasticomyces elasticus]